MDSIEIFGTRFANLDTDQALLVIAARPASAPFAYIATPNVVHLVGLDRGRPYFAEGLGGAWLRTCDSQIVRLFAWLLFRVRLPYAPGSDITARLFETVIQPDDALCIIGGNEEMANRLRTRFGLRHLRHHIPPNGLIHSPTAMEACLAFIRAHPARFVFLACGAPQSELLGRRLVQEGGTTGLGLCIGASLLFVTGLVRRAPVIWRRLGLEWLHRLIQEPRRLARRLLTSQLPFLWVVFRDRLVPRPPAG
jgi:exopolysaccharide biosynthesis WecB/TagA/CpsF family protein